VLLTMRGRIRRDDLPGLLQRAHEALRSRPATLTCDVTTMPADVAGIEALALLHIAARRHGCSVTICGASPELRSLADLVGLGDVLRL
jgi:ABC-type transporter Mla MlaB component